AGIVGEREVRVQLVVVHVDRLAVGGEELGAGDLAASEQLERLPGREPQRVEAAVRAHPTPAPRAPEGANAPLLEASQRTLHVSVPAVCRMWCIYAGGVRNRLSSRSGAFAKTSASGRHSCGSSSAHALAISSGCEVGGTSARSSSATFETASRIADSCSWKRFTSAS